LATTNQIAILGAGNIGTSIARGIAQSGEFKAENIVLTRRRIELLDEFKEMGFQVQKNNKDAVECSNIIILAVEPHQINGLIQEINPVLSEDKHTLMSVASGVDIASIRKQLDKTITVVRVMPNTAIAIRESMTCLASDNNGSNSDALEQAQKIFDTVGETLVIEESQMFAATALGACGIAFFLRSIRAASQGGIETGMHADQALAIAAQTAKGAASLLQKMKNHPEYEIDKVTTPLGCTIAGLNEMEHKGFSSAIIQGIKMSAEKAGQLY